MSRSTRLLLLFAVVPLVAIVAIVLLNRQRTRDYAAKPLPPPQAKPVPPTTTSPATMPAAVVPSESPVAVMPTPTPATLAAPAPEPTLPQVSEPTTTPTVASPAPPPAASTPAPNEDGIALLPSLKPPAPAAVAAEAGHDAATFIAFAPGARLLVVRSSGQMEFLNFATGQHQPIELKLPAPRAVALSQAGDCIVVGNAESTDVWHVTSSSKTHLAGGDVTSIAFARGGQLLTGHAGGEVKIWDGPAWTNATTMSPNVGAIVKIASSPASAQFAVIGASGGVAVCDAADHTLKQRLGAEQAWTSAAFSPDGRTIAAVGAQGVTMWDTILWQKRAAPGGSDDAMHVAFWRGGTVVVTTAADGAIRIYDLATRQLLATLSAGNTPVISIDLADDGRTIATSNAGGVTIWDVLARSSRQLEH
jgi:hypothetical protein